MEIWVNPACSKCRTAIAALGAAGVNYTVRRYLDDPPTPEELRDVMRRLGLEPWHLAREKESKDPRFEVADLPRNVAYRSKWIAAMVKHPILIQRPIITAEDGTTVIGRDPNTLRDIIARG
jgi:arsenate reductase